MKGIILRFSSVLMQALILLCLIAACEPSSALATDLHLFLRNDEQWDLQAEILFDGTQLPSFVADIPSVVDDLVGEMQTSGLDVESDWHAEENDADGNVPYFFTLSGGSLETLNAVISPQAVFNLQTVQEKPRLYFALNPDTAIPDGVQNWSLRITGLPVISTNGTRVAADEVLWEDFVGTMTAVFDMSSPAQYNWTLIVVLGIGGVVIILGVILISRFQKVRSGN